MAQRITLLATLAGLTAVLLGIVPTASDRLDAASNATAANATAPNATAAYNATEPIAEFAAESMPLLALVLVAGAILASTGLLSEVT